MSDTCTWCDKERLGIPQICHIKLKVQCEHCGHPIKYYDIFELREVFRENKRLKRRIKQLERGGGIFMAKKRGSKRKMKKGGKKKC